MFLAFYEVAQGGPRGGDTPPPRSSCGLAMTYLARGGQGTPTLEPLRCEFGRELTYCKKYGSSIEFRLLSPWKPIGYWDWSRSFYMAINKLVNQSHKKIIGYWDWSRSFYMAINKLVNQSHKKITPSHTTAV